MKKALILSAILSVALSLTACTQNSAESKADEMATAAPYETMQEASAPESTVSATSEQTEVSTSAPSQGLVEQTTAKATNRITTTTSVLETQAPVSDPTKPQTTKPQATTAPQTQAPAASTGTTITSTFIITKVSGTYLELNRLDGNDIEKLLYCCSLDDFDGSADMKYNVGDYITLRYDQEIAETYPLQLTVREIYPTTWNNRQAFTRHLCGGFLLS